MPLTAADNGQLALLAFGTVFQPNLPAGSSTFTQGVQQQLLWGYPDILWEETAPVAEPVPPVYTLEYRLDPQTIFWGTDADTFWTTDAALMWSARGAFASWPGQLKPLTHQLYEFRLTVRPSQAQGRVTGLTVNIDMPDVEELLTNITIAAPAGTRLPVTKTYQVIKVVTPILVDDGGSAAFLRIMDKDLTGPLVMAFTVDGSVTSGKGDFRVQGY